MCTFAIGIGAAAFNAIGAYRQARADKQNLQYQAGINAQNEQIALQRAEDAKERGDIEAKQERLRGAQLQAEQQAAIAANGGDVQFGASLDLLESTAFTTEMDAQTIKRNAEREAYGYEIEAYNFGQQSSLLNTQAGNINPLFSAASTFVSGASQAYAMKKQLDGS